VLVTVTSQTLSHTSSAGDAIQQEPHQLLQPQQQVKAEEAAALRGAVQGALAAGVRAVGHVLKHAAVGVDGTDALSALALAQQEGPGLLAQGAYALLLAAPLMDLPLPPLATGYVHREGGTAEEEEQEEENDQTQLHHPAAYLTRTVGLRPLLAESLVAHYHHHHHHHNHHHHNQRGGARRLQDSAPPPPPAYLTAWAVLLCHLMHRQLGQPPPQQHDQEQAGTATCRLPLLVVRGVCTALREVPHLVPRFMDTLAALLPLHTKPNKTAAGAKQGATSSSSAASAYASPAGAAAAARAAHAASVSTATVASLRLAQNLLCMGLPRGWTAARAAAPSLYGAALRLLPASARQWFGDLRSRERAAALERYTAAEHSPGMVATAIASMQGIGSSSLDGSAEDNGGGGSFTVRANAAAREVVAVLEVEEGSTLELVVRLPPATPLKAPEVECRRNMGIADARLRKWLLSCSSSLRNANSSIADAIGQWQASVRAEFSGLEPCLICFSVVASGGGGTLPRLQCRTCHVRFHPACLYKWFRSSGKSACPHCSSPW